MEFSPTEADNVYNLAFGDVNESGTIDDYAITNNGDRNKVLGTIADIVKAYADKHPERWLLFSGSTEERTRLYRMAISKNLDYLSERFEIRCIVDDDIINFRKGLDVVAFLIKRKTDTFVL